MRYNPLSLRWRSLILCDTGLYRASEAAVLRRMSRELDRWEGTPYRDGENKPKVGTYCTAFVCSVLDALYRREGAKMPEIPSDASMHCRATALGGLRWFLERYPNHQRIEGREVQPGDILVTAPVGGGPGHAILVGPRENTIWQCSGKTGVHFTGMALPASYVLHSVWRLTDRMAWI